MRPGTRVRITSPTALRGETGRVITSTAEGGEIAIYVQLDSGGIPLRFGASVVEALDTKRSPVVL